jgi:superfamily II DNA or RNA helicase
VNDLNHIKILIEKTEKELLSIQKELLDLKGLETEKKDFLKTLYQHKRLAVEEDYRDKLSDISVSKYSTETAKIELFRSLFKGREDVFPRRFESKRTGRKGYQPACRNEWIEGICRKPEIKCADCTNRELYPVTDEVVRSHLSGKDFITFRSGDFTIGVYPLLPDETCHFLALDFDKSSWQNDVLCYLETCKASGVPAYLERSRSGNGGHIWIFFSTAITAALARKLGSYLLTLSMEARPEIGLDSYDRLFPNQDTIPKGGFGNLIALPLQKSPRQQGNSAFIDSNFDPYPDQWAYLSSVDKMSISDVERIVETGVLKGKILGVRVSITDEEEQPWATLPSGRVSEEVIEGITPTDVEIVLGNQIYIDKTTLSPGFLNRLTRVAAFQNPEFYRAQAMRFSTFGKPRIISCAEDYSKHIALPRGCLDEVLEIFESHHVKVNVTDKRFSGIPVIKSFNGALNDNQKKAAVTCLEHDNGIVSASTAFGKTILAIYLLIERRTNTLILVHRRQLMDQWLAKLREFTDLDESEIGFLGGGKRKLSGIVDVALIQSVYRKSTVDDIVAEYGHVIVDECHHISAARFEMVLRRCKAKYVTGLTATIVRKDGHHPIIMMQCGPIRYRFDDKRSAEARPFDHVVILGKTSFKLPPEFSPEGNTDIHEVFTALIEDEARNHVVVNDVLSSIQEGRSPVLITERREHLEYLADKLRPVIRHVMVMHGGMSESTRRQMNKDLQSIPVTEERLIIATGSYLGEGFDDPRLDTLFLVFPISWQGRLAQYAGRLHRLHENKKQVIIYDYADLHVPVLARMFRRRQTGYKRMGYHFQDYSSNFRNQLDF